MDIPFSMENKQTYKHKHKIKRKVKTVDIMTQKQKELIKDNLRAYENNFGYIKIVKEDYGKGFYVFTSEERVEQGSCKVITNSGQIDATFSSQLAIIKKAFEEGI